MTGKRAAPKTRGFRRSRTQPDAAAEQGMSPDAPVLPAPRAPQTPALHESALPVMAHAGAVPDGLYPSGPALPLDPPAPATPSGAAVPAGNPSVLPSGAVPLGSRSLARHEARNRSKRLRAVLAVVAVVALLLSGLYVVTHRGNGTHHAAAPVVGPNTVVLLQVSGANGAGALALLGDQHGAAGAVVLVPPQLSVDAGGFGGTTMQKAATLPGSASANGLADALGIRIDGTWTLSLGGLAALVDRLGGINADVDVDVKEGGVIKVSAGQQHLDGVAAAAYATYAVPGEPAQAQLARLDTVLEAVIGGMANNAAGAADQVAALGASSQSSLSVARLGSVLAHLKTLDTSNSVGYQSLPVHQLDGAGQTTYTLDSAGAADVLSGLTGTKTDTATNDTAIRVLVKNGVGTPGLADSTRARLSKAGEVYVPGGNELPFDKERTVVLISEDTAAQRAMGDKVAAALGLTDDSLRVSGEGQSIADVVVVLGVDYRP